MPASLFKRPALPLFIAVALTLFSAVLIAAPTSDTRAPRVLTYEYAYLTIHPHAAVLETADALTAAEVRQPFTIDQSVVRAADNSTTGNFNALLKALNRYGAQGWELPPLTDIKPGVPMLIRRRTE